MTSGSSGLHHLGLRPTSQLGKWAVGLLAVSVAGFLVGVLLVASGQRGSETWPGDWLLTGPFLVAATSALGAGGAGILAVLRSHERGLLVSIAVLFGLLVTVFLVGELVSPH